MNDQSSLHLLARRYYHGELEYAAYRQERARIIDAIAGVNETITQRTVTAPHFRERRGVETALATAPAQADVANDPQPSDATSAFIERRKSLNGHTPNTHEGPAAADAPPAAPRAMPVTPTKTAAPTTNTPSAPVATSPAHRTGRWVMLAGTGLAVVLLLAWWLSASDTPSPVTEPASVSDTPAPAVRAIEEFLAANDWSAGGIAQFSRQWDALSDTARNAAKRGPGYQRLGDMLYQRIAEQRALEDSQAGEGPSADQQMLSAFADYLGLSFASLRQSAGIEPAAEIDAPVVQTMAPLPAGTSPAAPAVTVEQTRADQPQRDDPVPSITPSVNDSPPPDVEGNDAAVPVSDAVDAAVAAPVATALRDPAVVKAKPAATVDAVNEDTCLAKLAGTRRPTCQDKWSDADAGPLLAVLPAGEFTMGGSAPEEQPQHPVRIARPFAIAVNEISQREFALFCRATQRSCPQSPWAGPDYPVVQVSWQDANDYAHWLSRQTGRQYRLPSEAEWEYAARAGSRTPYPGGDELLLTDARFALPGSKAAPLSNTDRSINRNRFRLYHMLGNVREWVQDAWYPNHQGASADATARPGAVGVERVVRGGSYADEAHAMRLSTRMALPAERRDLMTGFRVVRVLE